jgi:excisionase family DNA binding protein
MDPKTSSSSKKRERANDEPIKPIDKEANSIDEFCELGNFGRSFVYSEIKAGKLKARKAGRRTLITRQDREKYFAQLPVMSEAI